MTRAVPLGLLFYELTSSRLKQAPGHVAVRVSMAESRPVITISAHAREAPRDSVSSNRLVRALAAEARAVMDETRDADGRQTQRLTLH